MSQRGMDRAFSLLIRNVDAHDRAMEAKREKRSKEKS
jgi:hypothetical protein